MRLEHYTSHTLKMVELLYSSARGAFSSAVVVCLQGYQVLDYAGSIPSALATMGGTIQIQSRGSC